MKYAIAQTSGKQFLIKPGEWYDVDFISNGNIGDFIYLNKILLFKNENKIQIEKGRKKTRKKDVKKELPSPLH
jgi:ribosomal protein L21